MINNENRKIKEIKKFRDFDLSFDHKSTLLMCKKK